jgi:hypothetical protein
MSLITSNTYDGLKNYFGDIHNHCNLSYGHGSLDEALQNARLQLDFVSVTVHAVWPDLPTDDPKLNYLIDYHEKGFVRAKANWQNYLTDVERANQPGKFVTFPSFEWHSIGYGDYCVYYKSAATSPPIIDAEDLVSLRAKVENLGRDAFLIPHHIGYKRGSRGINWQAFDGHMSPVAEIFSFHGLSEQSEGAYPYLHSMGPRHEQSTAQYGWAQGHIFGIIGSTDHHNAFPGSYGYGRLGVWAEDLNRESIWDAIRQRRTYALTGDNIRLQFALNDAPMGAIVPASQQRTIDVDVVAGDAIDSIDILHNNQVIHREYVTQDIQQEGRFKIFVEMGWGEQEDAVTWDVSLTVQDGKLHAVEPHLRGVGPTAGGSDDGYAYSYLKHEKNEVYLQTRTHRNPSLHTSATEGFVVEIEGDINTQLVLVWGDQRVSVTLEELLTGARSFYSGGFVSPAICLHRAIHTSAFEHQFTLTHENMSLQRDWYYVRVRQQNNQWAWSSPIWVEPNP